MNAHTKRQIAVAAPCDPATIDRYLSGKLRGGLVHARITAALIALNMTNLVQREPVEPTQRTTSIDTTPKTRA